MTDKYYIKKSQLKQRGVKGNLTLDEACDLLNRQDKLIRLMESTLRTYDGKWLFDGSMLSFAEVLNKLTEEEL